MFCSRNLKKALSLRGRAAVATKLHGSFGSRQYRWSYRTAFDEAMWVCTLSCELQALSSESQPRVTPFDVTGNLRLRPRRKVLTGRELSCVT